MTTAYDQVEYPNQAYAQSHPDQLALMAALHGFETAPADRCRVLEVGCSEGGNLLPMAYAYPGSEFVGFDLAAHPIEKAQARIDQLGLRNIRVMQKDMMDVGPEIGQFDYVIAHGFLSWVPDFVREKLLAVCQQCLKPNGVAYISYNAYPGGHFRAMLRDMMVFHTEQIEDPSQRVAQAKAFLEFAAASRPEGDAYREALTKELKKLNDQHPLVLYHDELSPVMQSFYFSEFVEMIERHGLQFISEATLAGIRDQRVKPEAEKTAVQLSGGDAIAFEQYLDFFRMRRFRQSLVCHSDVEIERGAFAAHIRKLSFTSLMVPGEEQAGSPEGTRAFIPASGVGRIEANDPVTIHAFERLIDACPHGVSFANLLEGLPDSGRNAGRLASALLELSPSGVVQPRQTAPSLAAGITARPRASALARLEAAQGRFITTLYHNNMKLEDELLRKLITLLDGTRTHSELASALSAAFPEYEAANIAAGLESSLMTLYRQGVLEA